MTAVFPLGSTVTSLRQLTLPEQRSAAFPAATVPFSDAICDYHSDQGGPPDPVRRLTVFRRTESTALLSSTCYAHAPS